MEYEVVARGREEVKEREEEDRELEKGPERARKCEKARG